MTRSDVCPYVVGESRGLTEALSSAAGLLVGLDFDGTLAPIVENPNAAMLSEPVEQPLRTLADHADVRVAIVSGRELEDLMERVGIADVTYAGNHGLELYRDGERTVRGVTDRHQSCIRDIRSQLRSEVADIPGSRIEDKGVTITVHARQASSEDVETIRERVFATTGDEPAIDVTTGKQVFEVRPAVDHDKGTAMTTLGAETPSDWLTLYLGDDTTDEDAFEAIQPDGVGIHVGENTETAASYRIPTQEDVPAFLRWLTRTALDESH